MVFTCIAPSLHWSREEQIHVSTISVTNVAIVTPYQFSGIIARVWKSIGRIQDQVRLKPISVPSTPTLIDVQVDNLQTIEIMR
jgi:hypothetical protein